MDARIRIDMTHTRKRAHRTPTPRFNAKRMARDIAEHGWHQTELAEQSGVGRATVSRFLSGQFQTAKTAKKLAEALGYPITRYILGREAA